MTPVPHYTALLDALRAKVEALCVNYEMVADALGVSNFDKFFTKPPMKHMSVFTMFDVIDTLGLQLHITESPMGPRVSRRAKKHGNQMRGRLRMQVFTPDQKRIYGRKGGAAMVAKTTPKQRSRRARKAALIRWADVKRAPATGSARATKAPRSAARRRRRQSAGTGEAKGRAPQPLPCPLA